MHKIVKIIFNWSERSWEYFVENKRFVRLFARL